MNNYVKVIPVAEAARPHWQPAGRSAAAFIAIGAGLVGVAVRNFQSSPNGGTTAGVFGALALACGVKVVLDRRRRSPSRVEAHGTWPDDPDRPS